MENCRKYLYFVLYTHTDYQLIKFSTKQTVLNAIKCVPLNIKRFLFGIYFNVFLCIYPKNKIILSTLIFILFHFILEKNYVVL